MMEGVSVVGCPSGVGGGGRGLGVGFAQVRRVRRAACGRGGCVVRGGSPPAKGGCRRLVCCASASGGSLEGWSERRRPADGKVVAAVEKLGGTVTVGDVAAKAGVPLEYAGQELNRLALDTEGALKVTGEGELLYAFKPGVAARLRGKYWQLSAMEVWRERVAPTLFFLVRASFGVVLLGSIALATAAILILVTAASSSRSNDRDRGGGGGVSFGGGRGGGDGLYMLWRVFDDVMWYNFWYGDRRRGGRGGGRRSSTRYVEVRPGVVQAAEELGFLESVFSFIFGDGDPNADLGDRRWRYVGQLLRSSGGAVAAEQLAPYVAGVEGNDADDADALVLPALVRFGGVPSVSDDGDLVYTFPSLQVTGGGVGPVEDRLVSEYLVEAERPFSVAPAGNLVAAGALGAANFGLVAFLGKLLAETPYYVLAQYGGAVGLAKALYPFLSAYALGFLLIPIGRATLNRLENGRIRKRNEARKAAARKVWNNRSPEVARKLRYARSLASSKKLGDTDVVYRSDRESGAPEQVVESRENLDDEWERLLEQRRKK